MFLDTQPMDLSSEDELAEFRVPSPSEMQGLLHRLIDGAEPVNLNAPDGSIYTTTLWALDTTRGRLSFAADVAEPRLQQLLNANRCTVVAYLESVKLLLANGADPNLGYEVINVSGAYTPFTSAVNGGHYEIAKLLCEHGARMDVTGGKNHHSLFHYVVGFRDAHRTEL